MARFKTMEVSSNWTSSTCGIVSPSDSTTFPLRDSRPSYSAYFALHHCNFGIFMNPTFRNLRTGVVLCIYPTPTSMVSKAPSTRP